MELTTCLWFDGQARQAALFYTSIFPNSSIEDHWITPTETPGNKKGEEVLEEFQTSEYFGSILLSNPTVLDLSAYPGGSTIISPNAIFDGEKFISINKSE